jgi:hypothetical protein
MSKKAAAELAGYSNKSGNLPEVVDPRTVGEIRERLQGVAGVTLADQVAWYAGVRENEEENTSDRISAAKQIDKVMGYEAPSRVEVSERREVAMAVQVFHNVLSKTGMSAKELVGIAEGEVERKVA